MVCGYLKKKKTLRTSPSPSAHKAGFSTFTSPTKPLINCDQGKIAREKSSPQPCDIHFISFLSRALLKMLTWLIKPINCPALGSSFARSLVRPTINSPPPVEHNDNNVFRSIVVYFLSPDLWHFMFQRVLHLRSHYSFFNFRYKDIPIIQFLSWNLEL